MSGLQARGEEGINGVDVREQGNTLRVATNTPHLVSLGTGRLSTAVTLHPIKQGRVTVGSDPTCDIYVVGSGVASVHCRVENSHGVVTLYPVAGSTLVDSTPVLKPTRLSQGSMLTIGRTNYLRFNHPAEAMLMKSVLPTARRDITAGYVNVTHTDSQCYQQTYKQISDDDSSKELSRSKPPIAPKDEKLNSIMAKVSKFEYYAKQQKNVGRSQFYTNNESEISPKVFSSNSLTVNTPAKDVLGGKTIPNYMKKNEVVIENNTVDTKGSYVNVAIRNNTKINEIVKNFDDGKLKKVNNDLSDSVYGKINNEKNTERNDSKYQDFCINDRSYKDTSFEISKSNLQSRDFTRKQEFLNNQVANQDFSRTQDRNLDVPRSIDTRNQFTTSGITNRAILRNQNNPETSKSQEHSRSNPDHQETSRSPELDIPRNQEPSRSNQDKTDRSRNQDRYAEYAEKSQERSLINGIGVPQYSPVYVNQYERAENMRVKAYQERVKEEEKKEAEMERLEEILDIFTEYQKQLTTDVRPGIPITPTEKRSHNKIITNGSLPRSVAFNNPNFVKTSEGFYKFETSQSRPDLTRNMSSYENFEPHTPEVTLPENYENVGRMDEIGIPVFDSPSPNYDKYENIDTIKGSKPTKNLSPTNYERGNKTVSATGKDQSMKNAGPIDQNNQTSNPVGSPYENLYTSRPVYTGLKPKSPNTSSPRTRIKTTFAHKNTNPQYFVFPTPSVVKKPNFDVSRTEQDISKVKDGNSPNIESRNIEDLKMDMDKSRSINDVKAILRNNKANINTNETFKTNNEVNDTEYNKNEKIGIEKQLSLEEDIPMIDDTEITNDIECRYSNTVKNDTANLQTNQSFEDVKKELMADIPELEAFENDLKSNKREKLIKHITDDIKTVDIEMESVLDVNIDDLKHRYDKLKEERRAMVTEIHEVKCKMTEITSQEDDILRELEMEKALIKGEYDSEIAILKIEQKKRTELVDKVKRIEEEIRTMKEKQEARQNEISDRVEIATRKVQRLEKDVKHNAATLEELQNAQDILDNESKIYEDLEFQHLEEESELLSNREDLQNEIIHLTKKIDAQKTRILTLKSEANNNLTSALDDTKILHTEYVKHLNNVEELTAKVQSIEKELKPIVAKLNEIERAQSPDSAFYTDHTRAKSGEFSYSPQTSDEDIDTKITNFEEHTKEITDKLKSIDQMSQSMTIDVEKRIEHSPKNKKGFWERNFDSLKRKKKPKTPEKVDVMSQSLNENFLYNNECIENAGFERFGSLRNSKKKDKGPVKSNSSSKIPTFAALGKIIKKDSFGKKGDDDKVKFIKNGKMDEKYKSKSLSPDKTVEIKTPEKITEEEEAFHTVKVLHRKSCGDEPNARDFGKISDSGKIPSQDDIDRISKVTIDAPLLSSDTDVNTLGKRTLDSLMEVERKRFEMLEEQGCQMIENEREKISELKRRAQDETKKLWDQKYREKSVDSDFNSLSDDRRNSMQSTDSRERLSTEKERLSIDKEHRERPNGERNAERNDRHEKSVSFDRSSCEKSSSLDLSSHEMTRDKSFDSSLQSQDFSVQSHDKNQDRLYLDRAIHDKSQEIYVDRASQNRQRSVTFDRNDKPQERTVNFDLSESLNQSINLSNHEKLSVMTVNFDRSVTDKERQEMLDFDRSMEFDRSGQFDRSVFDQTDDSFIDDGFMVNSTIYEESSGLASSSIEELQVRNSRTESTEDEKRSDDSRPLSHASDFSRDHILSLSNAPRRSRRGVAPCSESQRPLTRYLPVDRDDFDLRSHVESAGHQIELCPYVMVTSSSCRGYLHKLGAKFHTWSKRWFVFDRETKTFVYYWDKSEKKPRGGAYFQVIEEVYLDHGNTSKSPSPQTTFIVKTRQRRYYLMAPSGEAARIWIDAIFTGAQGYTEYLE